MVRRQAGSRVGYPRKCQLYKADHFFAAIYGHDHLRWVADGIDGADHRRSDIAAVNLFVHARGSMRDWLGSLWSRAVGGGELWRRSIAARDAVEERFHHLAGSSARADFLAACGEFLCMRGHRQWSHRHPSYSA